ncbi:MAG: cell division ATP-binding protein FtsE [Myxococcales bacterium]|nr:cell division ATP-binding protein FtsE [Myxococcales bacterium]MCB9646701.1 cell division ATP-binding protein FtsE [Deltaproteobacteria bacterium]
MIQTFHVTKVYDQGDRPALKDVSLNIEKGEFVFLTGPSGAGKSTLLKLLFVAERPTRGQILVNGRNVATLKPRQIPLLRRQVGVIFQDFKLIANRTVHENVAYALHVVGVPEKEIRRRVYNVLKGVGLYHKAHALPPKLSGGEQQRVSIARALVNDPVLLLADEPTGNLDRDITEEIMALLEQANARGTTVVVATHDPDLLDRYKKRVIVLKGGQLQDD